MSHVRFARFLIVFMVVLCIAAFIYAIIFSGNPLAAGTVIVVSSAVAVVTVRYANLRLPNTSRERMPPQWPLLEWIGFSLLNGGILIGLLLVLFVRTTNKEERLAIIALPVVVATIGAASYCVEFVRRWLSRPK